MSTNDSGNQPKKLQPRTSSKVWRELRNMVRLRNPHKDLSALLASASSRAPIQDRILWLSRLVAWLRQPSWLAGDEEITRSVRIRLRFLIQLLERNPEWRDELARTVYSLILETEAISVLIQTELAEQNSLFAELTRRIVDRVVPPRPRPHELGYVVELVFTHDQDSEWIDNMSRDDWQILLATLGDSPAASRAREHLVPALREAVLSLSVQAAGLGLTPELRSRMLSSGAGIAPFMELNRMVVLSHDARSMPELSSTLAACHDTIARVYEGIEKSGVSLALIYRLEALVSLLHRLDLIVSVLYPRPGPSGREVGPKDLLSELVRTQRIRRSIRRLASMNFEIFARKLVEHAGETGEHYITRTASEYWQMLRAGAGGGVVVVATTFAKFLVSSLKLPLLLESSLHFFNYASSFIFMQFCGFALATKQPAMTAAALAERLRADLSVSELREFAEEVARITRSQFIAAVGNVGVAVPVAWLVSQAYVKATGHVILSPAYAEKTLNSLHAWQSLSILYASLTGVLLWLSSLGAGWLQNWVIYRGLPEAIAHHRLLNDLLGERRSRALGAWISHNAVGIGGNVSIAFLLALIPLLGTLSGLPLDIRHVTLSSSTLTVALTSLDPSSLTWQRVLPPVIGVALIGVCNFGVSTVMALIVAVRAQRVRKTYVRGLLLVAAKELRKNPWRFFFPPRRQS